MIVLLYSENWTRLVPLVALAQATFFHDGDAVMGATWKPDPDAPTVKPQAPEWGASLFHAHLSISFLTDVRAIEVLRIKHDSVLGMLITHSDGSAEATGSYDPANAHLITTIYEASSDGPLLGVAFESDYGCPYCEIEDVKAVTASSPAPGGYEVFENDVSAGPHLPTFHNVMRGFQLTTSEQCTIAWSDKREFDGKLQKLERGGRPVRETWPLAKLAMGPDLTDEV